MPTAHLDDRAIVTVSGPDAESFLQNIVTADLDALYPGEAKPSALLTPQGKILFDFLISRNGPDAFRLECRADIADDFVRRLTLYKLRAKVEISKQDESLVALAWGSDSSASETDSSWLRDTRFPHSAPVQRSYEARKDSAGAKAWHAFRIANGIAESGSDYVLGDAFPHDVLLDQMSGVGFRKGCYVGQEVVSRMQHRGTARRRVLIVSGEELPSTGTEIVASGRLIGTLGSSADGNGLAILRIDRVKDALDAGTPIEAGRQSCSSHHPRLGNVHLSGKHLQRGSLMAADKVGAPPRAWQRMLSGRRLDLLDPSPLDIEISDIAHGLARVARWNGQTGGDHAFSVAQHSLLVEDIFSFLVPGAPPDARLTALLHDAPEYVIGDMISPFKSAVGGGYKAVEQRLQRAIHLRFGLASEAKEKLRHDIKRADQIAAYFEATLLAGFSIAEAAQFFGRPRGISADSFDLACKPAKTVQAAFLKRFASIEKLRGV